MVVAPNYTIGVTKDIAGEESVIVKSASLANYMYQSILKNGREISYAVLDRIIQDNLGRDITDIVNTYVSDNFGHAAEDMKVKQSPMISIEMDVPRTNTGYTTLPQQKYYVDKI